MSKKEIPEKVLSAILSGNRRKHRMFSSNGGKVTQRNRKRVAQKKYVEEQKLVTEFQEIWSSTNEDICPLD